MLSGLPETSGDGNFLLVNTDGTYEGDSEYEELRSVCGRVVDELMERFGDIVTVEQHLRHECDVCGDDHVVVYDVEDNEYRCAACQPSQEYYID